MKLSDQVVSLELAKRLKELGVRQLSIFWWMEVGEKYIKTLAEFPRSGALLGDGSPILIADGAHAPVQYEHEYAAFTVAELGEMLPPLISEEWQYLLVCEKEDDNTWRVAYERANHQTFRSEYADTEADARARMLIYLLENKLITAGGGYDMKKCANCKEFEAEHATGHTVCKTFVAKQHNV